MIANAQWITLADWRLVAMPVLAPFVAVRRDIDIPASVGKLILHITASAGYTLWIDGELVASGPARSWPGEDDVRYCLKTPAGRLCARRRRGQWKLDVPRGVKVELARG